MDNAKLTGIPGTKHIRADSGTILAKDINNLNRECDYESQWNLDHTMTGKLSGSLSEPRHLSGVSEDSGKDTALNKGMNPRFPEQKVSLSPYYSHLLDDIQAFMP